MTNSGKLAGFSCVLFDFDDTIVQSRNHRLAVLEKTLKQLRQPLVHEGFRTAYGQPFRVLIEAVSPGIDFEAFVEAYTENTRNNPAQLVDGVEELIVSLRDSGRTLGIISLSLAGLIRAELAVYGLDEYFELIRATDGPGPYKPDPQVFYESIATLNQEPAKTVFIGDSPTDETFAESAGIAYRHIADVLG